MPKEERLSSVCKSFVAAVVALGASAVDAVIAALAKAVTTDVRILDDGRELVRGRSYDLLVLLKAVPELNREVRDLSTRFVTECAKRGARWEKECGQLVIADHLVGPLKAAQAKYDGAKDGGALAGKVAQLQAQIAAVEASRKSGDARLDRLEALTAPKSEPVAPVAPVAG